MNMWKVSLILVFALCMGASAQAAGALDVKSWEATSYGDTVSNNWIPGADWICGNVDNPDTHWRSSHGSFDYGTREYITMPDLTPAVMFFFDDVCMVDYVEVVNYRVGGNAARGASLVNIYVLGDNGVWDFFSTEAFTSNNRWSPEGELEYHSYAPFTFNMSVETKGVMFEFVTSGPVRFLSEPYGYDPEVGYMIGQNLYTGEWTFNDNPGDCYVGLYNVTFFGTKVPEPATMSLLALGGLALLRRRSR